MSYIELTYPSGVFQATVEDIVWGVDTTLLLSGAQTPTNPTVTLTDPNGNPVSLQDTPTVVGNIISQRIRAGILTAGQRSAYVLTVTFTVSGTTNILSTRTQITVPY